MRPLARLAVAAALVAAAPGAARSQERDALFETDAPLEMRLTFDFRTVFRDRDSLSTARYPARLTYVDSAAGAVSMNIFLRPRGHYRLMSRNCAFTPIRLMLPKDSIKGPLFKGHSPLKLVTHCRNSSAEHEEYVLREYLVYKIFNLFTARSYRARLVRATYVDSRDTTNRLTRQAFLIEDDESMAKRTGTEEKEVRRALFRDVDADQMTLVGLFELLIGNTDWSLASLHNIRVTQDPKTFVMYPVPYDFDFSGLVDTRYSHPPPGMPIKSVRDRLHRGPCRTRAELAPFYAMFNARRDAITALYRDTPGLDKRYATSALAFIEDFYRIINNPGRARANIEDVCQKIGA